MRILYLIHVIQFQYTKYIKHLKLLYIVQSLTIIYLTVFVKVTSIVHYNEFYVKDERVLPQIEFHSTVHPIKTFFIILTYQTIE